MLEEKKLWQSKLDFDYYKKHTCKAVVVTCIDFRLWRITTKFIDDYLGFKLYDFPKLPGGAKAVNESKEGFLAAQCVKVPCELHQVEKIVVINHSDCGAYGGVGKFNGDMEAEKNFHKKELKKAYSILSKRHPDKEIILIYAQVDKDNNVQFLQVQPS